MNKLLLGLLIISSSAFAADNSDKQQASSSFETREGGTKIEKLVNYANSNYSYCQFMMTMQLELRRLNNDLGKDSGATDTTCISDSTSEIKRAYKVINTSLKKKPQLSREFKSYITVAISSFEGLELRMSDNFKTYDQRTSSSGEELKKAGTTLLLDAE